VLADPECRHIDGFTTLIWTVSCRVRLAGHL
jgi:hypothetical protein